MLTLPLEVGKKYVTRQGNIVEALSISEFDSPHGDIMNMSNFVGLWQNIARADASGRDYPFDVVSDYTEPNKEITYDKKQLLQAILNDKTLQFRVDENETWQDVVYNDWVLRMIADKSKFCFRVKPDTVMISDGEISYGDMAWWHAEDGPIYDSITDKEGNWGNARRFPEVYSIKEPEFEMVKVYKYLKD